ncbi:uncharacterized protein ACOB7L_013149 isoform 1-T2 [Callospermophilus lateralis]|uniref:uncharacterized protein LOC143394997 isoform X1 n=1 Tax=Callospermophilus lateralis TaxID=76772 RepID=UPI004053A1C2
MPLICLTRVIYSPTDSRQPPCLGLSLHHVGAPLTWPSGGLDPASPKTCLHSLLSFLTSISSSAYCFLTRSAPSSASPSAGLVHRGLRGTLAELAEDRGWTCGGPPPHPGTHHRTGPFFSTCLWPPSRIGLRPSPEIQRGKGPQHPGHSTPAPSSPEPLHSHGDTLHTFPRDRPDHDSGTGASP